VSTHRWPRLTIDHPLYGIVCECGNLKTDQALTCTDCAVDEASVALQAGRADRPRRP
jgi:hypothetical protein